MPSLPSRLRLSPRERLAILGLIEFVLLGSAFSLAHDDVYGDSWVERRDGTSEGGLVGLLVEDPTLGQAFALYAVAVHAFVLALFAVAYVVGRRRARRSGSRQARQ